MFLIEVEKKIEAVGTAGAIIIIFLVIWKLLYLGKPFVGGRLDYFAAGLCLEHNICSVGHPKLLCNKMHTLLPNIIMELVIDVIPGYCCPPMIISLIHNDNYVMT